MFCLYFQNMLFPIGEVIQKKYHYNREAATGVKDGTEAIIDYSNYCQIAELVHLASF